MWPATGTAAPRRGIAALLTAGVIGAVALSGTPGLGWLVTAVAVGAAVLVTSFSGGRPTGYRLGAVLTGALALPVLLWPTLWRAAGWLDWLCALAALGISSMAWTGAHTWRALVPGGVSLPVAVGHSVPWLLRGVQTGERPTHVLRTLLSGLVGVLLLVVFGALFASADSTFAQLLDRVVRLVSIPDVGRAVLGLVFAAALTAGAALLASHPPALHRLRLRRHGWLRRIEWALPVALLDLLFLAFVLVQISVLFGGRETVLANGGPDYAEYARQGFAQLSVVTVLTLLVVAVVVRKARRRERADRRLLRILLGALCLLALVVVASAVRRLELYENVYGYTRLRLVVHAAELWLGAMLVLVLVAGIRLRGRFLPTASVLAAALTLLSLAWLDPDAMIATHNVQRYQRTGRLDTAYLATLSTDAVPALDRLPEPERSCALAPIAARMSTGPWYTWTVSGWRARAVLANRPALDHNGDCSVVRR